MPLQMYVQVYIYDFRNNILILMTYQTLLLSLYKSLDEQKLLFHFLFIIFASSESRTIVSLLNVDTLNEQIKKCHIDIRE